jgi:sugar O-acyltransferase (sialic acid O-acetyltransferase NeuD family)
MQSCFIYGTGGHARVLYELATLNRIQVAGFCDDHVGEEVRFLDLPVRKYMPDCFPGSAVLIGVGSNHSRRAIASTITHAAYDLKHPGAVCAANVMTGAGSVILSGAVVQTAVRIGNHCIINAGCVVDHDAIIKDFVHIGPRAYIGGGAIIGEGAVIGPGAVIMRQVKVPDWTEVPPNAVIF